LGSGDPTNQMRWRGEVTCDETKCTNPTVIARVSEFSAGQDSTKEMIAPSLAAIVREDVCTMAGEIGDGEFDWRSRVNLWYRVRDAAEKEQIINTMTYRYIITPHPSVKGFNFSSLHCWHSKARRSLQFCIHTLNFPPRHWSKHPRMLHATRQPWLTAHTSRGRPVGMRHGCSETLLF
jgi:hypothetical protein